MTELSDNYSNASVHRSLTERLRTPLSPPTQPDGSQETARKQPSYVRFKRRASLALAHLRAEAAFGSWVEQSGASQAAGSAPQVNFDAQGVSNFQDLAERCQVYIQAETVFVVDGDGLVVAAVGQSAQQEAEALGARILVALDQARQIDPSSRRIDIPNQRGHWVALRSEGEDKQAMTLVFLSKAPPLARQVAELETALGALMRVDAA